MLTFALIFANLSLTMDQHPRLAGLRAADPLRGDRPHASSTSISRSAREEGARAPAGGFAWRSRAALSNGPERLRSARTAYGSPGPERCHSTWPSPSTRERSSTPSHSWSMRFRRATASGGCSATAAASRSAASSVAAAGATLCTRPQRSASSALDVPGRQQQVLGHREAAEGDQPGGADRDAERRAGEPHPQVRAADPQVAGDGDLGAAAHAGAVAGGDGRLREAPSARRRGGRTAPSGGRGRRRRAPRGRRRRPRGPCGRSRRGPARAPARRSRAAARCPSISSSIWVLIAFRASGRSSRSRATPASSTS